MSCKPKCAHYGKKDEEGRWLMLSQKGNLKYPENLTIHPQCLTCLMEDIIEELQEEKESTLKYLEKNLKKGK